MYGRATLEASVCHGGWRREKSPEIRLHPRSLWQMDAGGAVAVETNSPNPAPDSVDTVSGESKSANKIRQGTASLQGSLAAHREKPKVF